MNTNTLTDADRARLLATLPPDADRPVAEAVLSRVDTLPEAEAELRRFTPAFPAPQDVPLPSWATDADTWTWETMALDVPCWQRSVSRATVPEWGSWVLLSNTQSVTEEGGPVGLLSAGAGLFVEDRDITPDELAALGSFLLDAADALRHAQD